MVVSDKAGCSFNTCYWGHSTVRPFIEDGIAYCNMQTCPIDNHWHWGGTLTTENFR